MRGVFVTGTDTGAGKSVVAASIAAALASDGLRVTAYKPVVTGLDEPADPAWPPDLELLGVATGGRAVVPHGFGPPVSPHLAAELAGRTIDFDSLVAAARRAAIDADRLVVEGVGGLLVPLTADRSIRDLAAALGLPVVVAARPGLGTINHTLLTVESARAAGLSVAAIVMTPWSDEPSVMERSNRATVERLSGVTVTGLPPLRGGTLPELRRGGEALRAGGLLAL